MPMESMFMIVDFLVLGCGVYVLYGWLQLRKAGHLIDNKLIYPNGCTAANCKEPEAFYAYMMPRFLLLGILTTLDGIVTVVNDFLPFMPSAASLTLNGLFFAFIVYFAVIISRSYKRFF